MNSLVVFLHFHMLGFIISHGRLTVTISENNSTSLCINFIKGWTQATSEKKYSYNRVNTDTKIQTNF